MIIWVNGAFGAGKTIVSHELCRRLDRGWIADPEPLGFALQRMHPPAARGDFQDYPQWRSGIRDHLAQVDDEVGSQGPVIVPMALLDPDYFTEIVGGLRDGGHDVQHVGLQATPDTIRRRLRSRGLGLSRDLWAESQIDRAVAALARPAMATGVPTDGLSVAQVVERVAEVVGLTLPVPAGSRVGGLLRNVRVSLRHIRW